MNGQNHFHVYAEVRTSLPGRRQVEWSIPQKRLKTFSYGWWNDPHAQTTAFGHCASCFCSLSSDARLRGKCPRNPHRESGEKMRSDRREYRHRAASPAPAEPILGAAARRTVGTDNANDLALIQIFTKKPIPYMEIADSVNIGETVISN